MYCIDRRDEMNKLIEYKILSEKQSGDNFMYILRDNNDFLITEYKVLQNQTDNTFLKCMKILYNRNITLYYETDTYSTLQNILSSIDANSFINIVSNLLRNVVEVKNNGFLSCQNIDLSFEKIFVNRSNFNISLVYIPIRKHIYTDYISFETDLKTKLIEAIHQNPSLQSLSKTSLEQNLFHSTITNIVDYMRLGDTLQNKTASPVESVYTHQLKLMALNAPIKFELIVDKNEFVIGKKKEAVDGFISFNSAISREHCKITQNEFGFKIEDLGSANGTYVNRQKLISHKVVPIKNGDIIRLANSDFQVLIQ